MNIDKLLNHYTTEANSFKRDFRTAGFLQSLNNAKIIKIEEYQVQPGGRV